MSVVTFCSMRTHPSYLCCAKPHSDRTPTITLTNDRSVFCWRQAYVSSLYWHGLLSLKFA